MKTLHASLMSLLLLAITTIGPVFADVCYDDTCGPMDWDNSYAWNGNDWADWCYDDCWEKNSRIYLGPVYYHRNLHFSPDHDTINNIYGVTGPTRTKGNFVGVNVGYEYKGICNWYGRVDGVWSTGILKGCPRNRVNDWFVDGRLGYTFGECSPCGWSFTPYVGIGYFWLDRKFKYVDASARYDSWYVPVGFIAEVELMPDFTIGVDASWLPEFSSRATINSSTFVDVSDGGIKSRYGWRVEVPFSYVLPCDWNSFEITIAPFWQQFHYGYVNQVLSTPTLPSRPGLPRTREDFWGAKFLIGYLF